jgi:proteasome lid subunit RPN8/RPN11
MASELKISRVLWFRLAWQLQRRGGGIRESGAFLLGRSGKRGKVSDFICYDDLDPRCLDSGIIRFDGSGYVPLWKLCAERGMKVVADVHTHPTTWTEQSGADCAHPMVAQSGHLALILPRFAQRSLSSLKGAGVYRYHGQGNWETLPARSVKLTLF